MSGRHRMGMIAAAATLLATAPMAVIYERWTWLFQCLVVVVAVATAATVARALRAPAWLQPPVTLLALLAALTWLFPSGEEILAILPGPGTLAHFAELIADAPTAMRSHSLPAPDEAALLFITALGIGVAAIVVDVCVVAMRRPALAGLPMLAVYSVPVAVRSSAVPPLPFIIGAAGYLWLLGADHLDRVRRFGRRFSGEGHDIDAWEPSPLAAAGRRLTVVGVAVAIVLPLVFPGFSGLVGRVPGGFGSGYGVGPGTGEVNLFAELSGRLNQDSTTEMLRVTTDDPDPFYLRFAVATEIGDSGFAPQPPSGLPVDQLSRAVPQQVPTAEPPPSYQATVEITEAYNMPMVPIYHELVELSGLDSEWLFDPEQQVVFSRRARAAGLRYHFSYVRPEHSPADLRMTPPLTAEHPMRRLAEVPEVPEVAQLVAELTAGADNPYDRVLALFRHFSARNGFRYSVETGPETTGVAIVDFLENKVGFCVQYAAALAWMVRTAGIPARVAFGFTRGSDQVQSTTTLTNRNLHAWTEVYFAGVGWVPFDATPVASVRGGVETEWATHPDSATAVPDPASPAPTAPGGASGPDPGTGESVAGGDADDPAAPAGTSATRWPWHVALTSLLLVALLSMPAARRAVTRRRRLDPRGGRDPRQCAHDSWDELLDTLVDLRWGLDPTETPRATAARLLTAGRLSGPAAEAVRALAAAEERARYAPTPLPPDGLATAARTAARALVELAGRRTRWRARVAPPSVLSRWRLVVLGAAGAVRGRLSWGSHLVARLSPRRLVRRITLRVSR